eukprot:GFUD01024782.1.p1 GENE.GFUD01024782.1~~GFUD01024782.1.p1  ORF type:complete len:257 (+),score=88.92 GFUD01024782.1:170-940(+)
MKTSLCLIVLVTVCLVTLVSITTACNEAVCASIVSKCMLLQSCKCELHPDCTCCKKCFECLDYLYSECCSCVDMCPKPNVTIHELSRKSHVEELDENIPTLFQALTDQEDVQNRWSIVTFPIDIDMTAFQPINKKTVTMDSSKLSQSTIPDSSLVTVNCTVAYMSQCMSWNKCKASCTSMGASSYRWFHDGCCECVGNQCINYGINQSRCEDCPVLEDDEEITDEEMEMLVNMDYDDFTNDDTSKTDGKAKDKSKI